MRRIVLAALLAVLCTGLDAAVEVGSAAQEIGSTKSLNTPKGEAITLASLKGKVVVIDFWATWCGPCVKAIPHMQKLHDTYGDKGLVVVGHTDASSTNLEAFIKDKKITYPISVGNDIGDAYGVTGIPHVVVVGADGKVVWRGHPAQMNDDVLKEPLAKVEKK